ncbi:MAG: NAD(P)/FAD-dependent oxidoreductase [Xanthobacteraceae bacterium]
MPDLSERIAALSAEQRDLLLRKLQASTGEQNREPEIERRTSDVAPDAEVDLVILGGGLAGHTLARQIKRARPAVSILLAESRPHPFPESAHKVGESSVEIGGHYFSQVLGLEPHLRTAQLLKAGLRYFFTHGDNQDTARRVEMGASFYPPTPGYQLDRGRLENFLAEENRTLGVDFRDRTKARSVTRDDRKYYTALTRDGEAVTIASRWVVDASGRAGLIKRQLGLAREVGHNCNSVWFRLGDIIDIDLFGSTPEWDSRLEKGLRRFSTNHFMGRGYWVWFIPLAPNVTSVGIVADAELHPLKGMNSFERALDWLRRYEPACARVVEERRDKLMDFLAVKRYAYGCARVFSKDRWGLTGEAGVFTDPFYSPGSDFIGMGNTYLADLILRDLDGEDITARAADYNRIYLNTFESFLTVYENQYALMGNPRVMPIKIVWDFLIYWGFLALQFIGGRICDLDLVTRAGQDLQRVNHLNARIQALFREWDALDCPEVESRFIDVLGVDLMRRFHFELKDSLPGDALAERFSQNLKLLESLAVAIFQEAARNLPGAPSGPVNPYSVSLNSAAWAQEGLFNPKDLRTVDEWAVASLDKVRVSAVRAPMRSDAAYAG